MIPGDLNESLTEDGPVPGYDEDAHVAQQWEYHHERWDLWPSLAQGMQRLTNLGEDGWELVSFWEFWDRDHGGGGLWAIFKRPYGRRP